MLDVVLFHTEVAVAAIVQTLISLLLVSGVTDAGS